MSVLRRWCWEGWAACGAFVVTAVLLACGRPLKVGPAVWLGLLVAGAALGCSGVRRGPTGSRAFAAVWLTLNLAGAGALLLLFGGRP